MSIQAFQSTNLIKLDAFFIKNQIPGDANKPDERGRTQFCFLAIVTNSLHDYSSSIRGKNRVHAIINAIPIDTGQFWKNSPAIRHKNFAIEYVLKNDLVRQIVSQGWSTQVVCLS